MNFPQKNGGGKTSKPAWKILFEYLVYPDQNLLYRICRKMIIYLERLEIEEIKEISSHFRGGVETDEESQKYGANWPKPKVNPFIEEGLAEKIFEIASEKLSDETIAGAIIEWLRQEQARELSLVLEKRHAPLAEVDEAVKKFLRTHERNKNYNIDEIMGLRVGLIYRFLSENLSYINIAKNYISIRDVNQILNRTIGPANGNGKLGGKSSGMILAREILNKKKKENPLLENVHTPKSRFLTSDALYDFLHYNALEEFVFLKYKDVEEIREEYSFLEHKFKNSTFPPETIQALNLILDDFEGSPIIVRSSSLLEDSFEAAFSGKYKSLFLSNIGTKKERLEALTNAIAEVYASSFAPDPIEYRKERGLIDFREEMGILIQQVVGNKIGKYFFPSYAGVAFSSNEMRWSTRINREDGVIRLVAGLGTRAVDRTIDDYPALVSPGKPNLRVNQSFEDAVRYSQTYVDVIDLEKNRFETIKFSDLVKESKGNIPAIEKIVSFVRENAVIDPISVMDNFEKEDLIVTFNNLINKSDFIPTMNAILSELQQAFGEPVDIEFASDGKKLYLLQCRPQSKSLKNEKIKIPAAIDEKNKIFSASKFVNNGYVPDIEWVVLVDADEYSKLKTPEQMRKIARIIGRLNNKLPRKKFILLGPGRWGSKGDIKLGVPVAYSDINNSAMLIEISKKRKDYSPELSFGTHFFQDLVEADIKYLPLYPDERGVLFNRKFFYGTKNYLPRLLPEYVAFEHVVKVTKVEEFAPGKKLFVYMDGDSNQALAFLQ